MGAPLKQSSPTGGNSCGVAALVIAKALQTVALGTTVSLVTGAVLFAGALAVGSSTVWLGAESAFTMAAAGTGLAVLIGLRQFATNWVRATAGTEGFTR